MLFHFGGDVEIARGAAHGAGIAFAGHAQPRSVPRAGRNAHFHRLRVRHAAIAAAGGAGVVQLARAAAARAGQVEPHGAGHLDNLAGAFALRAGHFARARRARAVAGRADLVARDVQARLGAADGLPEVDVQHVFEIVAFFRLRLLRLPLAAAVEELRKDIAEAAAIRCCAGRRAACARPASRKHRKNRSR